MVDKEKKIGLFDFTNELTNGKTDLRTDPRFEKDYNPFMINRVLSMSPKTCHLAMFMSGNPDIPKAAHFLFYLLMIDREKIYFNYIKRTNDIPVDQLKAVQKIYNMNIGKAKDIIKVLSDDQLKLIEDRYEKINKFDRKKNPKILVELL
jgi:hypothetical protein